MRHRYRGAISSRVYSSMTHKHKTLHHVTDYHKLPLSLIFGVCGWNFHEMVQPILLSFLQKEVNMLFQQNKAHPYYACDIQHILKDIQQELLSLVQVPDLFPTYWTYIGHDGITPDSFNWPTYNSWIKRCKKNEIMYHIMIFTRCAIIFMWEYRRMLMPQENIQCINTGTEYYSHSLYFVLIFICNQLL